MKSGADGHPVVIYDGRGGGAYVGKVFRDLDRGRWRGVILMRPGPPGAPGAWVGITDVGGPGAWFKSRKTAVAAAIREALRVP